MHRIRSITASITKKYSAVALFAALVCAPLSSVRAAEIDTPLKPLAADILLYAQHKDRGWKNIGVLNFRVKVGGGKESWNVGRLNTIMAVRLENALILQNSSDSPIGITRNAGEAAIKQFGKIDYMTPQGRKKLLKGRYPLAWGNAKVKVDAFLTGVVEVSNDYKTVVVKLEVFDQNNMKLRPLPVPLTGPPPVVGKYICSKEFACFKISSDRGILADLEVPFSLASRKTKLSLDTDLFTFPQKKKPGTKTPAHVRLSKLLDFRIHYSQPGRETFRPVAVQQMKTAQGTMQYRAPTPTPKQKVRFTLEAKEKSLGVVVLVNGLNTIGKEKLRAPQNYSRWILKPNVKYTLQGFYTTKGVRFFEVRKQEEAPDQLMDQTNLGKITIYVFRSGEKADENKTDMLWRPKKSSLRKLKSTLAAPAFNTRGVIVDTETEQPRDIKLEDFPNPQWFASKTITYFERSKR